MQLKSVFLSHSWGDKEFARKLAGDLVSSGVRVWVDEGEIMVGDSLIEKIRIGIDEMDYLAVVLSPNSVSSAWVKKEVDIAMNQEIEGNRIKVLPLVYKQCELPWFLKGKAYLDFTQRTYHKSLIGLLRRLGVDQTHDEYFFLDGTNTTPLVEFTTDYLQMRGVLISTDPVQYFNQLTSEFEKFLGHLNDKPVQFEFELKLIHSGAKVGLRMLFWQIRNFNRNGGSISVTWKYDQDDEDLDWTGRELQESVKDYVQVTLVPAHSHERNC